MQVEILLSTYNGERFLSEQLESIEKQTFKNWKLLIRDDGSKDRTINILKEFKAKYPNQVEIFVENNIGTSLSFFRLLKLSRAPYIMFCDQDDVWFPDKIEKSLEKIRENEIRYKNKAILLHTNQVLVDENLNIVKKIYKQYDKNLYENINSIKLLFNFNITGCTMIMNEEAIKYIQKIKEKEILELSKLGYHDTIIGLIISEIGEIVFLNKATMLYRVHSKNQTISLENRGKLRKLLSIFNVIKKDREVLEIRLKRAQIVYKICKNHKLENKILEMEKKLLEKNKFKKLVFLLNLEIFKELRFKQKIKMLLSYLIK